MKTQEELNQEVREKQQDIDSKKKKIEKLREKLGRKFDKKAKKEFLASLSEENKKHLLNQALDEYKNSPLGKIIERDGLEATILGAFILKSIPDYMERKNTYISNNVRK